MDVQYSIHILTSVLIICMFIVDPLASTHSLHGLMSALPKHRVLCLIFYVTKTVNSKHC